MRWTEPWVAACVEVRREVRRERNCRGGQVSVPSEVRAVYLEFCYLVVAQAFLRHRVLSVDFQQ